MSLSILVVGLHVYLLQKLIKILEDEGHYVIAVFSSDMVGKNLRSRDFDVILVNIDVNKKLKQEVVNAVQRYQPTCPIVDALYEKTDLLSSLKIAI